MSKVYIIRLKRYRFYKNGICGKDSIPLVFNLHTFLIFFLFYEVNELNPIFPARMLKHLKLKDIYNSIN